MENNLNIMGIFLSTLLINTLEATVCPSALRLMGLPLKRKIEISEDQPPRKRRLLSNDHIDKKRLKLEKPDIQISAFGKIWNLHKAILCESPYFNCMFNGSWRESSETIIAIKFPDVNITKDGELRFNLFLSLWFFFIALEGIFTSLYSDEIVIDENNVLSLLAIASMLQMDDVILRCSEVMEETIFQKYNLMWQKHNLIPYFEASNRYGITAISRTIQTLLESNLMDIYQHDKLSLKEITSSLLTTLVSSHIFIKKAGKNLYPLLRTWLYFMLFPAYTPSDSSMDPSIPAAQYFLNRVETLPFLLTDVGCKFSDPFRAAIELKRFKRSLTNIRKDNIIPEEWLSRY